MVIDGVFYGLGFAAGSGVAAWLLGAPWAVPFLLLAAFSLYFFRDPERVVPSGPVAVSPADGKIVSIRDVAADTTRVSIFLNVFDVHVNRAPIAGTIVDFVHRRGRFLVASKEQASEANEHTSITIQGDGTRVVFKQIAGLIARRIVFYRQPGESVAMGERVGLIKFGSRVDVFFGPEWDVVVRAGHRVAAGSSILARRRDG